MLHFAPLSRLKGTLKWYKLLQIVEQRVPPLGTFKVKASGKGTQKQAYSIQAQAH